jgi:ABC-2 type transport system ATP-binding protein
MIEFEQVRRSYGDRVAVDCLNLRVNAGELYSLLGHNGAGKTTTIRLLVGLLRPESGAIRVGGYDVVTQTRLAASLTGYVPDQPFLYEKLTGSTRSTPPAQSTAKSRALSWANSPTSSPNATPTA